MKFARRFCCARTVWLAVVLLLIGASPSPRAQQQPAQPLPLDVQKSQQALQLFNQGKYAEAAQIYEAIPRDHPSSALLPEVTFRLAYIQFLTGEYDKAIETLQRNIGRKCEKCAAGDRRAVVQHGPPGGRGQGGEAGTERPGAERRVRAAIKEFDTFIAKFPQSEEIESANYGKARAHYQLQHYEQAAAALRSNLQKFPQSPSTQDTQFMLAVVLGTHANVAMQKLTAKDPVADAAYEEAVRLLADIIQKRSDVALANDAQFQLAELLFARSNFATGAVQKQLARRALEAYRAVLPKDAVIKAQQDRLAQVQQIIQQAGANRDVNAVRRVQRLLQREQEKMVSLEQRPDQTFAAKIKSGQVFVTLGDYDAARVLFRFLEPFTDDAEQKKQLLYFITVTYAAQHIADKAVEHYDKFMAAYKGDSLGENLPLLLGSVFLDPKNNDPEKALKYFAQEDELYPKSRYAAEAVMEQALALIPLEKYDEALGVLKKFLASNPTKQQAAAGEFGLATIYQKTQKTAEAINTYKDVRDKYAGTPQAEQAAFWVAQLSFASGDSKTALEEFKTFLARFPQGELAPPAMLFVGQAQASLGQKEAAGQTYKELAQKYPKSDAAVGAYFQRATMAQSDGQYEEVKRAMREFIEAYPGSERLFGAYDYIGQVQSSQKDLPGAVATYEEFIAKHPNDPNAAKALLKIAGHWKAFAEAQGIVYLNLNDQQKAEWKKGVDRSIAAAEKLIERFPESPEVALALQSLLAAQRMQMQAKLKSAKEVEQYFSALAKKFEEKRSTKSKILFALAGFMAERDKAKALEIMTSAYDPKAVYAPADLDLYGSALIEQKKYDDAKKVFAKLAADYPVPPGIAPGKAPKSIWEPQSVALFGTARILQEEGNIAEAQKKFEELKTTYPYSPKLLEADYGIAASLFEQKKDDEALKILANVSKQTHAPAPLRAKAMLLLGKTLEREGKYEDAINNFVKIGVFFEGVPDIAAEGLWLGAQLQEQQAEGKIPMSIPATPAPRVAPPRKK